MNELWLFDLSTYEWEFINTTAFNDPYNRTHPQARELHSATMVNGDLLVFGGKSRLHALDDYGNPILTNATDQIYNDLWMLSIDHLKVFDFHWNYNNHFPISHNMLIPQDSRYSANIQVSPDNVHAYYPGNPFISKHSEGSTPRTSQCIKDTLLEITFYHDCINQLRFTLQTSGPVQGSPNYFPNNNHEYEILLLSKILTNTTNCISGEYTFVFHDQLTNRTDNLYNYYVNQDRINQQNSMKSQQNPIIPLQNISFENSHACCFDANQKVHHYYSNGKLSELIDQTLVNNYTLIIEDMKNDFLSGHLIAYNIYLQSISCQMRYHWKAITPNNPAAAPIPRYNANILTFNNSIFIFGGKDAKNLDLQDLYRYDLLTNFWYSLTPKNFYSNPLNSGNSIGSNYVMTSYGLIRFGGYYRQPYLANYDYCTRTSNGKNNIENDYNELCYFNQGHLINSAINSLNNYDNNIFLMDPITLRWQLVNITILSSDYQNLNSKLTKGNNEFFYTKNSFEYSLPTARYYSSLVFIPSNALQWNQKNIQLNSSDPGYIYDINERILYDNYQLSSQFNYQSSMSDSLLLFGGFDSSVGILKDGSSGGYLQDTWLLRLNSYSTKWNRAQQLSYISKNCQWRMNPSARLQFGTDSCLSTSSSPSKRTCQLRDLFLLVWCSQYNQTMS